MSRGKEAFLRRQKELARQERQKQKALDREARRARRAGGDSGNDDVAAIQAALDAGLNPGSAEERVRSDEGPDEG